MASVAGYVNFGSIKGNSDDANHKEWIEVSMVSQDVYRNIDPTSKPKDALSKSQVQLGGINFTKNADESSPELVAAVCKGEVFPEVTIDLVRVSEGGNEVFYQWVLTNAYVSNYGVNGSGMGELRRQKTCHSTTKPSNGLTRRRMLTASQLVRSTPDGIWQPTRKRKNLQHLKHQPALRRGFFYALH